MNDSIPDDETDSELVDITGNDGLGAKYQSDDRVKYLRWGKHVLDDRREIVLLYALRAFPSIEQSNNVQLHVDTTCYLDYERPKFVPFRPSDGSGKTASFSEYHDVDEAGLIDGETPVEFIEGHFADREARRRSFDEAKESNQFSEVSS